MRWVLAPSLRGGNALMGCFLACFGFSKKRKRRITATKAASSDHRRVSYVPLDSSVRIIGVDGGRESLISELYRDKAMEQKRLKTRKKVNFNLNVQTHEPISTTYHFLDSYEEEEIGEKNVKETSRVRLSTSASERDSTTRRVGLFPSNYRYQNVQDSYEEEESELHDNDIDIDDEDDYYDDDEDSEIDEQQISQEGFSEELCSALQNGESEYPDTRDNIRCVNSVLSPERISHSGKQPKQTQQQHQSTKRRILHYFNNPGCLTAPDQILTSPPNVSCKKSQFMPVFRVG